MSPAQGGAGSPFGVTRLDTAQAIRSAASGVDLVYAIIAWGILILGALGLLVAEMIVVRDRTWFFGLSRAVGGRGTDIAILVLADIVLVLVAGTVVALLLAPILQPFAASFAYRAFQIPKVRFLHASTVPQLIAGEFVVLLLAGAYPALRAVRQDPLDVLEPRVS
jgi:putative ABC transport system permease protein